MKMAKLNIFTCLKENYNRQQFKPKWKIGPQCGYVTVSLDVFISFFVHGSEMERDKVSNKVNV